MKTDNTFTWVYDQPLFTPTQLSGYVISIDKPWIKLVYRSSFGESGFGTTARVSILGKTALDVAVSEGIPPFSVVRVIMGKPR